MSWEDHKPQNYPCPCGKGRYAVVVRSDDWNRFEQSWKMLCPECADVYVLHSCSVNRKGFNETQCGWIPKPLEGELNALCQKLESRNEDLTNYLKLHYAEKWRQHFAMRKKKEIWKALTNGGQGYPSLATFYSHVRCLGMEGVLNRYVESRHIETLIRVLKIKDALVSSAIMEIEKLKRGVVATEKRVRQKLRA
jgi:hypothetical protein